MSDSMTSKLTFLDLPVEIRLNIYRFLIPDNPEQTGNNSSTKALRLDENPCAPALLRTNSTIYHELVQEWYCSGTFDASLTISGIRFGAQDFPPYTGLPSTLHFVTSLHLWLELCLTPDVERPSGPSHTNDAIYHGVRERVEAIVEVLTRRQQLRQLKLTVYINLPVYVIARYHPANLQRILVWCLSPLEKLRIRQPISYKIVLSRHRSLAGAGKGDITMKNVVTRTLEYLERLKHKVWLRDEVTGVVTQTASQP